MYPDPATHASRPRFIGRWSSWCLAVLTGCGVWLTLREARETDDALRSRLLAQASAIAAHITRESISDLTFDPSDLEKPQFQRLHSHLKRYGREILPLLGQNQDYLNVYGLARRNDAFVFGPESLEEEDPRTVPPGTRYEEPPPELARVFESRLSQTVGPYTDEQGTFVSAFAPVLDSRSGEVLMAIGLELEAADWKAEVLSHCLEPVGFTLGLLLAVGIGEWLALQSRRRGNPDQGWLWRNAEAFPVLFGGLVLSLFLARTAQEFETRRHLETFRQLAGAQLRTVQDWLMDLRYSKMEGLSRFFEGSQLVEQDEFQAYASYLAQEPAVQAWGWISVGSPAQHVPSQASAGASEQDRTYTREPYREQAQPHAVEGSPPYAISFVAPQAANQALLVYDVGSEPLHRAGLDEALRTGLPTATAPVTSPAASDGRLGMMVFDPVYTPAEPRRLKGFTLVVLEFGKFLLRTTGANAAERDSPWRLQLTWLTGPNGPVVLEYSPPQEMTGDILPWSYDPLSVAAPLFAFGQTFALVARPTPSFSALYPARAALLTTLAGFGLTATLTALVGLSRRRRLELETQVRRRTAELRTSEESYRRQLERASALERFNTDLVQNAIDIVYTHDLAGNFTSGNPAAERLLGYTHEELLGMHWERIVAPDYIDLARQQTVQKLSAGKRTGQEHTTYPLKVLTKSGKEIWLEISTRLLLQEGRPVGVQGIGRDITQRRQAEMEILRQSQRLANVIESANVGTWEWNVQSGETVFSERWAEIIGYRLEELAPISIQTWKDLAHPEDLKRSETLLKQHFAGELAFYDCECRIRHKDGRWVWVHDRGKVISWTAQGQPLLMYGTHSDITPRKRAEEVHAQLEAQLRHAQKLEAVGQLAGGVAHDFNNILAALMVHLDILRNETNAEPEVRAGLDEMAPLLQRAATLTRQLLLFARRGVIQRRTLDLNSLIADLLKMLGRLIDERAQLSFQAAHAELWINADPGMLEQVITNLVVNARDAMPNGGRIDLQTRQVEIDATQVGTHPETRTGRFCCLTVRDTGCGMDESTLQRLFEPFFTTKEVGKGTGLGLSTVQGIVQQHGGWIEVESAVDQGSTFRIFLPSTEPAKARHTSDKPPESLPRGHETILVVEDEVRLREATVRMLQRQGYQVLEAGHGQEAFTLWKSRADQIHLVLTDMVMPEGMGGFELLEQLRQDRPSLPVVLMTGYSADLMKPGFAMPPGTRLLQKPFPPLELLRAIRQLLDGTS